VEVAEPGARPDRRDAGLLRVVHGVVDRALELGERAVDRQGAGDVGRVQRVRLHARVEQQQVAGAHGAVVARPVQRGRVRPGGADRAVADVVALDPGPAEEGALDPPLRGRDGPAQLADHVREALGRRRARPAQLLDLPLVLHHARAVQEDLELLVEQDPGLLVAAGQQVHDALELRVVAAHDPSGDLRVRGDQLGQLLGGPPRVAGGQAEQRRRLRQGVATSGPQLAVAAEPERAVLPARARQQVERRLVPAVGPWLEDQHAVVGLIAGQVDVVAVGAEPEVGVVRARLEAARGDHQALSRERGGQRLAPLGRVGRLGGRLEAVALGVRPAGAHVLRELLADPGVEAVLSAPDLRGLRGLRGFRLALLAVLSHRVRAFPCSEGPAEARRSVPLPQGGHYGRQRIRSRAGRTASCRRPPGRSTRRTPARRRPPRVG
jgi:hypothetical protein